MDVLSNSDRQLLLQLLPALKKTHSKFKPNAIFIQSSYIYTFMFILWVMKERNLKNNLKLGVQCTTHTE
jgi:hypothetical protein